MFWGGAALPITCHSRMSQLSLAGLGKHQAAAHPRGELPDITPGKGGEQMGYCHGTAHCQVKYKTSSRRQQGTRCSGSLPRGHSKVNNFGSASRSCPLPWRPLG